VADDAANRPRPFDVKVVRALIALMSQHDLSEIDLCEGDERIRLRRGPRGVTVTPTMPIPLAPAIPLVGPTPLPSAPAEPVRPAKTLHEIKSQLVGTFYAAAKPGEEPFVRVGARVMPTTVVGLVEAMKIYNEITAECNGVVAEILVENQQPVEFEQVLFRVDPSA
jgi:acetyl-CoA carboxylase biotin carboxyl carrier protein